MTVEASWYAAYVGVGSNLNDPAAQVRRACTALAGLTHVRVVATSRLYHSPPVGYLDQPAFVNAVVAVITQLDMGAFFAQLRQLEVALGKTDPTVRFGPRCIDLDLLVYAEQLSQTEQLVVPHPRLHERAFVLYPFNEIAPDLWIAGHGRVRRLAQAVDGAGVVPLMDDKS